MCKRTSGFALRAPRNDKHKHYSAACFELVEISAVGQPHAVFE